jgi:hypothetical protein
VTMNMPHYMFYAPGVTDADIGGKPFSLYPFMLRMSPAAMTLSSCSWVRRRRRRFSWNRRICSPIFAPIGTICARALPRALRCPTTSSPGVRVHRCVLHLYLSWTWAESAAGRVTGSDAPANSGSNSQSDRMVCVISASLIPAGIGALGIFR